MAATLFESLLMNHPFVDGNNRIAFFSTDVFLRMNGWKIEVDADDSHRFLIGLEERRPTSRISSRGCEATSASSTREAAGGDTSSPHAAAELSFPRGSKKCSACYTALFSGQSKRGAGMRAVFSFGLVLLFAWAVGAQTNVGVELDDVTDNRMSSTDTGGFQVRGGLEVRLKVTGDDLDKALGARVLVKEAKDDAGNSLLEKEPSIPDFSPREYNNGTVQISVLQPARAASSVRLKGTVELYVPGRDPGATVKIANGLAKLDAPLSAKALQGAKIEITPLSADGYASLMTSRKITDADIEKIRAEAKKEGADEKDVELAIELARAFESMDEPYSPGSVYLSGETADFDRVYRLEVLGADGAPLEVPARGVSSRGESSIMTLNMAEPPPPNATLELMLLTDKSRVSFPFDVEVELP